jgi:acetoin utilization deacetylase AcuC-like enzyme
MPIAARVGRGANLNIPLPRGTGDADCMTALDQAVRRIKAFAPGALVVALGLDASEHDPLQGLKITTEGFRRIGAAVARIGLPTMLVQEGGYLSDILGVNLAAALAGNEASR